MTNSKSNCAVTDIKADDNIDEGTYNAMGIASDKANMGYGLDKFGYSLKELEKHSMRLLLYDEDRSGGMSKDEVVAYIGSLSLSSSEEKACLFVPLKDAKVNPYGSIPNYLGFSNASSSGGGSVGYRRSKSTKEKRVKEKAHKMPSWEDYVKDYISNTEKAIGLSYKNWDSPMDAAYRKKIQSIIKRGVDKS